VKLFTFTTSDDQTGIGVDTGEGIYNFSSAFDLYQKAKGVKQTMTLQFLQVLVEMGYCSSQVIEQIMTESWVQAKLHTLKLQDDMSFDLPITRPSKIIGLGRNYRAHAKELNHALPKEPLFFSKAPSTLIPHEGEIVIPNWLDSRVDHEAELAVVIGKTGKDIPESEAMDYIAGYTIVNDVTARTIQKDDTGRNEPWFRSKSLDTFCPVGPYLVPADTVSDPHDLDILLTVNGDERQAANTADMIFKLPHILSHVTKFMTLHPGDIIATGTPEGVSPIQDGDVIEISITGLGTLRNRVVRQQ